MPQSNNQDKVILKILFNWHQQRQSYYDDYQAGAMTEKEWNKTRDNVDSEALTQLNNLLIEARIDELEMLPTKVQPYTDDRIATLKANQKGKA